MTEASGKADGDRTRDHASLPGQAVTAPARRALQAPFAQIGQRLVGLRQRIARDLGLYARLRRHPPEIHPRPRASGWRPSERALLPQQAVRETAGCRHMDPAAHDAAAVPTARGGAGTSAPTGAKMIAASSGSGRVSSSRRPTPHRRPGEVLRVSVTRPGEGVHPRPWRSATWASRWAAVPKPYMPRLASPPPAIR